MSERNTKFLAERFPLMFDADDERYGEWFPLPADFPKFLRSVMPKSVVARDLVIELYQRLPFGGGTVVRIGDEAIERRTGIDRKSIQDARRYLPFQRWVTVVPGEKREPGKDPISTVYDLKKLQLRYNSWHYRDEVVTPANDNALPSVKAVA